MKVNWLLSAFVVVAVSAMLFGGGPARADQIFQLDNGVANDVEENNANGQMMWLNHYTTPGGMPYLINQLGVAFANNIYPGCYANTIESQTVYVDLYSDPTGGGNPNDPGVQMLAEGSFNYDASNPPSSTTLTWAGITPTEVTGSFFVGATAYCRADLAAGTYDNDGVTLSYVADNGNSYIMWGNTAVNKVTIPDRDTLANDTALGWQIAHLDGWYGPPGVGSFVEASGVLVPEPSLALLAALGAVAGLALIRRW